MNAMALDDSRLLDTWDRAASLDRPWRELMVLESASGIPFETLARLSIGERDRMLLGVRIGTFGSRLECETTCPTCGTRLQLALDASALVVPQRTIDPKELEVTDDKWQVRFRLPDSTDIAACAIGGGAGDGSHADDILAERCIAIVAADRASDTKKIPERLRERIAERMSALDPQADVSLDLKCAACDHKWQAPFDPAAFLLREVDGYAARLTVEVHQLARAYGWSEGSILAMGPTRRRRYLSLLLQ
jgi:hypothetical protein